MASKSVTQHIWGGHLQCPPHFCISAEAEAGPRPDFPGWRPRSCLSFWSGSTSCPMENLSMEAVRLLSFPHTFSKAPLGQNIIHWPQTMHFASSCDIPFACTILLFDGFDQYNDPFIPNPVDHIHPMLFRRKNSSGFHLIQVLR